MSSEVTWYSQTSVLIEMSDLTNWDEFYTSFQKAHAMIRETERLIDVIIIPPRRLPPGNPILHFRSAMQSQPPNTNRVIVVPPSTRSAIFGFIKKLAAILNDFYPEKSKIIFVNSIDEVERFAS